MATPPPTLKVHESRRFLQYENGRPFFWLADTAWQLIASLNRTETLHYLDVRARQGFTAIQTVALAELDGLSADVRGYRPLVDNDPARPDERPGPDNDYSDHVDFVVREANARRLYVGLLPTWGDK